MLGNFPGQPRHLRIRHGPFLLTVSGQQMLHTDPCFVHGTSSGVDGEWTPCPLCLCWLWSHIDSMGDVLRRWMVQACWAVFWQGLYQQRTEGWSPNSWNSQIFLPCSCTGWWGLCLEDLAVACPVPSSRWGVHGACGVVKDLHASRSRVEFHFNFL